MSAVVTKPGLLDPWQTWGDDIDAHVRGGYDMAGIRYVAASGETQDVKDRCHYVCDGTDDEVQINAAIADLTPSTGSISTQTTKGTLGGKVVLVGRRFDTGDAILGRHFITLEGLYGPKGTWLWPDSGNTPGDSGGVIELFDGNQQYFTVRGLGIQGSARNVCGIYLNGGTAYEWDMFHVFQDLYIFDCGARGISINGNGGRLRGCHYSTIRIINSGGHGLYVNAPDSYYHQIDVGSSGGDGIHVVHSNNRFTNCKSWFSDGDGFAILSPGRDNQLSACESQDNAEHGFLLTANSTALSACLADSNSYAGGTGNQNLFDGYNITGNGTVLAACTAKDKNEGSRGFMQRYGFNIVGTPKVNISACTAIANVTGAVNGAGGSGSVISVVNAT